MPADGTASSYMPVAASGLSSRKGLPGSSTRSMRSRASSLPRSRCLRRADSLPPSRATASRCLRSSTSSLISAMGTRLALVNQRRYPGRMTGSRREQILATAADLFAARGFHGVSVVDLGAACGISGPALYKHFASKDAVLAEMLVSISERLLEVGRERSAGASGPASAVRALVDWHVDFALNHRSLIVVQDRDWESLPVDARERVRSLQRDYVDVWADRLREVHEGL